MGCSVLEADGYDVRGGAPKIRQRGTSAVVTGAARARCASRWRRGRTARCASASRAEIGLADFSYEARGQVSRPVLSTTAAAFAVSAHLPPIASAIASSGIQPST